jgi:CRP/FNR family transcriptional regulator, cyclic AMP receptor protein
MISPEILRRYPFFGTLSSSHLQVIADIAEIVTFEKGATIFEEGQPANELFLLMTGSVDLFNKSEEEFHPKSRKDFSVGEVNPGEPFGLSAMLEPHILNTTARASQECQIIKIDANALRSYFEKDRDLGCQMMTQTAKALQERLASVRVQLAAAWAP